MKKISRTFLISFFVAGVALTSIWFCLGSVALADQVDAYPDAAHGGQAAPPPPPPERRGGWRERYWGPVGDDVWSSMRVNAKLFYNFAGTGYSYNGTVTNGGFGTTGALSVDTSTAAGLGAEIFSARPFGWGYSAGLDYDFVRNIKDFNSPSGVEVIYTGTQPTMQFTTIYGNFLFRRWNFYLPLGLNYTIPSFQSGQGNGAISNSTFTGNIGYQIAVGVLLGDRFSLEFQDRVQHFTGTSTSGNLTINWGDVWFSGLQLNLKFALL